MYPTHVYAYVGLPINNPDQPSTCYAEQMNQLRVGRNVLGLKLSLAFQKRETTDDRNFRDSSRFQTKKRFPRKRIYFIFSKVFKLKVLR